MKKTYEVPKLTTHGSISEITLVSRDSTSTDVLLGTNNQTLSSGLGSTDACLTGNFETCKR